MSRRPRRNGLFGGLLATLLLTSAEALAQGAAIDAGNDADAGSAPDGGPPVDGRPPAAGPPPAVLPTVPPTAGAEAATAPRQQDKQENRDKKDKKKHNDENGGGDEIKRATGDDGIGDSNGAAAGAFTIRTLLQTRFRLTFPQISSALAARLPADPASAAFSEGLIRETARQDDGFSINRAFLRLTAQPIPTVGGKLLVDFAELLHKNQKKALKLAYGEITPNDSITVYVGLFKIPFSLLELLPIADFELADVGPTDELIKDLGFGGRDIGAMVEVAPMHKKKWLHLSAGAFRGNNNGAQDYRGPGIFAARAVSRPNKHLRFGADVAWRPRAVDDWDNITRFQKYDRGLAASVDATVAFKKFQLRTEGMWGARTDVDITMPTIILQRRAARTFMGAWGILSRRIGIDDRFSLLPTVRAEWLDENREEFTGSNLYLSGGINLDYADRIRLLLDVSQLWVEPGTPDRSVAINQYKSNATIGVLQLQLKM